MTRALSREESKLITRRRLLEAAAELLGEQGYGKLSASAVARAAGIAQPTFYVHFRDKQELIQTLAREKLEALRRPLREARQRAARGEGTDALRDTFRMPLQALVEHPELFRLYIQEAHQPGSPFGAHARELGLELEADLIEDLIASGARASTKAERERLQMIAQGVIALTETLGLAYLDGRYPDTEAIVDVLTDFALGALGALPRR
jgi:TetR/AcrR family transcriptional regulator, fatty acid biosynthesis regulator